MSEMKEDPNQWCFACGSLNPIGLKLHFEEDTAAGVYRSRFTAGPEHQSYNGVMHGGLVSTLLDEIMGRYYYAKGKQAVTAKLEVRFRAPTPIGQELLIEGRVVGQRGKMAEMTAQVRLADGSVTAEGKALVAILGDLS